MGNGQIKKDNDIFYIQLIGEIDGSNTKKVIEELDIANAKEYVKRIVMSLVTYGGDILYGFALFDHIKSSLKPVDIITEGMCMSTGVMILQAGRKRFSRPHTIFMVHPAINSIEGKSHPEFISIVDQYKKDHEIFVDLSIGRSGISREDFEAIYNPRRYLTPEEALRFGKHGLIDEIANY